MANLFAKSLLISELATITVKLQVESRCCPIYGRAILIQATVLCWESSIKNGSLQDFDFKVSCVLSHVAQCCREQSPRMMNHRMVAASETLTMIQPVLQIRAHRSLAPIGYPYRAHFPQEADVS